VPEHKPPQRDARPPTLRQTIASVGASFFGVQSSKNRERDFRHGRPLQFVVVGVVMTAAFALALWLVVQLVLRSAGR
jgi:hypothetical protein